MHNHNFFITLFPLNTSHWTFTRLIPSVTLNHYSANSHNELLTVPQCNRSKTEQSEMLCCSWFDRFSVCGCRLAYCLPCPTWWWPSLCPSAASWPTTCAARTSCPLPTSGKSWTVEVRRLSRGWNIVFHTSLGTVTGCYCHGVGSILLRFQPLLFARWDEGFYKNLSVQ